MFTLMTVCLPAAKADGKCGGAQSSRCFTTARAHRRDFLPCRRLSWKHDSECGPREHQRPIHLTCPLLSTQPAMLPMFPKTRQFHFTRLSGREKQKFNELWGGWENHLSWEVHPSCCSRLKSGWRFGSDICLERDGFFKKNTWVSLHRNSWENSCCLTARQNFTEEELHGLYTREPWRTSSLSCGVNVDALRHLTVLIRIFSRWIIKKINKSRCDSSAVGK